MRRPSRNIRPSSGHTQRSHPTDIANRVSLADNEATLGQYDEASRPSISGSIVPPRGSTNRVRKSGIEPGDLICPIAECNILRRNTNPNPTMKAPIVSVFLAILCTGCSNINQKIQAPVSLPTLPADPHQATSPHWVTITRSGPVTLISKAEIDLNSVQQLGDGEITAWVRDIYSKDMNFIPDYSYRIGDTHWIYNCANGTTGFSHIYTRKENGDLVRSIPVDDRIKNSRGRIIQGSEIASAAALACNQAKENWQHDPRYDLRTWPKENQSGDEAPALTSDNKEEIRQTIANTREAQKSISPLTAPLLMAEVGKNICQPMKGGDGNSSPFELCVANGMFSHDIYEVRIAGVSVIRAIDDDTTKEVDGKFYGGIVNLRCDPVNQLANDVTNKSIEDSVESLKKSMAKASFEDRMKFAIRMNTVEVGRHCTLSNSAGEVAKMSVKFPG